MKSSRVRIYVLLSLLTLSVGVVTSIATREMPTSLQPYLWLSWPMLGVLAFLFIVLRVREARQDEAMTPRVSDTPIEGDLSLVLDKEDWVDAPDKEQHISLCTTNDGVRLAYATVGQGPPLVKACNWLGHLDLEWRSPCVRHWIMGLSEHHLLVRYDARGCGLSDWSVEDFSFEAWVRDLDFIVNALSLDRFSLLGMSQGGPIAIAYTVQRPERVKHLILYGAYARGIFKHNLTQRQIEQQKAFHALVRRWWGRDNPAFRQVYSSLFIPDGTMEHTRFFNELQRLSTSPENAVKFFEEFGNIDVHDLAKKVTVPTLVLHCREDMVVPFKEGRQLAALIPGARFVPLESKNHILLAREPAWQQFLSEVHRFVGVEGEDLGELR